MTTTDWVVTGSLVAFYLWGWLEISWMVELAHPADPLWRRIGSYVLLFLFWWYVALCLAIGNKG